MLIGMSSFFGTICILVQVAVILADVIGRYFGSPLTGARDLSQMAMALVVFGGMAQCDRIGGHISIDVFESYLPSMLNRLSDIISPLIGAAVFLGIAWTVLESAALSRMLNLSTNIIYLPKAWFQYAVVVMCIITAIAMLLRTAEAVIGGRHAPHDREGII